MVLGGDAMARVAVNHVVAAVQLRAGNPSEALECQVAAVQAFMPRLLKDDNEPSEVFDLSVHRKLRGK